MSESSRNKVSKYPEEIVLGPEKVTLGRGIQNTYIFEDVSVSRRHCYIEKRDENWFVVDISSNGTSVNGNRVGNGNSCILKDGDSIDLSEHIHVKIKIPVTEQGLVNHNKNTPITDEVLEAIKADIEAATIEFAKDMDNQKTDITSKNVTQNGLNHTINKMEGDQSSTLLQDEACAVVNSASENPGCSTSAGADHMKAAENELQCTICMEMFIKAMTLNCSHTFCSFCITEWKKKKKTMCPICRTPIKSMYPTLVIDNFIAKVMENADEELKAHRAKIEAERQPKEEKVSKRKRKKREQMPRIEPDVEEPILVSDEDSDNDVVLDILAQFDPDDSWEDWDSSSNESSEMPYNGVPGAYYGGYGHCYRCGDTGHWANGCPNR